MKELAIKAGFDAKPLLLDCEYDKFIRTLTGVVESLNKGDLFLFTFAGHGAACIDENYHINKYNEYEAICLRDGYVWDLEVGYILNQANKEARIITVYDCCHGDDPIELVSSSDDRGQRARLMRGRDADEHHRRALSAMIRRREEILKRTDLRIQAAGLHFAACGRNQLAKEDDYPGVGVRGHFSHAIERAYAEASPQTYRELLTEANGRMERARDQDPDLRPLRSSRPLSEHDPLFQL
jgi:hypothetical protein